jgi:hypothetical protein
VAAVAVAPALAVVIQHGRLRVTIAVQMKPYKLPRGEMAPIDVFIAGHIASTDGSPPPQLRRMEIKLSRRGRIDGTGLPRCRLEEIATSTGEQALARCAPALVGSGHFWASVVLPDQPTYHTTGQLLVFNGTKSGRPVLLAHIYTSTPFPSSFAIVFSIRHLDRGPVGTVLSASLPQALGDWGFVNRIKMTLGRTYRSHGHLHSFLGADCPAPKGFTAAVFRLATVTFHFAGHEEVRAPISRSCGVRG